MEASVSASAGTMRSASSTPEPEATTLLNCRDVNSELPTLKSETGPCPVLRDERALSRCDDCRPLGCVEEC